MRYERTSNVAAFSGGAACYAELYNRHLAM